MLNCSISYEDGSKVVAMVNHPGDGNWHTLRTDFVIPAQANQFGANSFQRAIALGRAAAIPALIDDVRLTGLDEKE